MRRARRNLTRMKKSNKIRLSISYGSGVISLPEKILESFDKARKFDIKVLLLVSSDPKYRSDKATGYIAEELECDERDVEASLTFWKEIGIVEYNNADDRQVPDLKRVPTKAEISSIPKRVKVSEIPQYTTKEMNDLLKAHSGTLELIDECQNIIGKIFTAADIKVLMGLVDYMGLDNDYILVLMHYAAKNDQKSMRYIEKLAVSCLDDGFNDASELQKELYAREERNALESKIKNIFGLGTRKLTVKEKAQITAWTSEYKYDLDVIEKAYEITVSATSKSSIHYANAILEGWYKEGAKNLNDVNALREKREQEKSTETDGNSSFNVDDFFDAALKRSYSEK